METIGHAHQNRRDPLDGEFTTTSGKESCSSCTATESVGMADLEEQRYRESGATAKRATAPATAVVPSRPDPC